MMNGARQGPSVDQIAAELRAQAEAVARRYCSGAGAYVERGQFYALSPFRADRHVGSFHVTLHGRWAGRWHDHATGEHGDMLDLIRRALDTDMAGALREARAFLGYGGPGFDPAAMERRRAQLAAEAGRAAAEAARKAEHRRRAAQRLWLEASAEVLGSPVDAYLLGRGLDLRKLGRVPRAIRAHPRCKWRVIDRDTGEITEGEAPAMVTLIAGRDGRFAAVHRVWLAQGPGGGWAKHPALDKPKKVLGAFRGGSARIWRGAGDRPLGAAEPGSRLALVEGVEDALAVALLRPDLRVIAAVSLSNMADVALPDAIGEVIVCGDNDESQGAQEALERALDAHRAAGRRVRLWRSPVGKDAADLVAELEGAA